MGSTFENSRTLFKTEIRKAWSFPIFELAAGFVALVSIATIPKLQEIVLQSQLQVTFNSLVADAVYSSVSAQMLPLGLFCGILVALSFARDYEQGLMQTLLSSPLSRSSVFIVKFLAVIVPLTFLSWGLTTIFLFLNFYSNLASAFLVLQFAALSLLTTFLAVLFFGGLAVLISLSIKRAIPAALTAMILGFLMYFVTTLKTETIGSLANYLAVTPFKAPLVGLGKLLGIAYAETTIESSLSAGGFLAIALVYIVMFVVPAYLYFTRRFEVRE